MKRKTIERLLQDNQIPTLDFMNDESVITWTIMSTGEKIVGKRVVDVGDGAEHEFYPQVPLKDQKRCESLYNLILCDFVDCYGEDLYFGSTGGSALFSAFAGPQDEGLVQILDVFGKTYDQFLINLFFWYGAYVEEYPLLHEDEVERPVLRDLKDIAKNREARLTRRVLANHVDSVLTFIFADDSAVRWEFAVDHEKMWYHKAVLEYVGDEDLQCTDEYGSFNVANVDAWAALQDFVLELHWREDCEAEIGLSDALGFIGICVDDLEDEDEE